MTASVQSPADVVNLALRRIGYRLRVGSLYDGSEAAKKALDIYGQTRDALLRAGDWGFAERNVPMNLLKSAPPGGYTPPLTWTSAYPPLGWLFEYTYPTDCLRVRAVKGTSIFTPNFDPQPNVFSEENDNSFSPPRKVILCNVPAAILVYTGQVTDPATWEADFVEALAAGLARRLAASLASADFVKLEGGDEQMEAMVAASEQG